MTQAGPEHCCWGDLGSGPSNSAFQVPVHLAASVLKAHCEMLNFCFVRGHSAKTINLTFETKNVFPKFLIEGF